MDAFSLGPTDPHSRPSRAHVAVSVGSVSIKVLLVAEGRTEHLCSGSQLAGGGPSGRGEDAENVNAANPMRLAY